MKRAGRLLIYLCVSGSVGTACGSNEGSSPTAPGPASPDGFTAPAVAIAEASVKNRTVSFTWPAAPGATSYVLEIGRTPGGREFAAITLEDAVTSYRATDMPVGISFARVRATNATTTSTAGPELRFILPDLRDIIEALFFQTGPHAAERGMRPVMLGWPQGSNIPTRVWSLDEQQIGKIEQSLRQVEEATNGSVRGTIVGRLTDAVRLNPTLVSGELQVIVHPDIRQTWCAFVSLGTALGCADWDDSNGVVLGAWVMAQSAPGSVLMHEIGHAVLGLHHIQLAPGDYSDTIWPGLPQPVMFSGGRHNGSVLTPMELDAIRMVYAAGLRGGARRSAFFAAGLINNP